MRRAPGDSLEQQQAEPLLIQQLAKQLGVSLRKRRLRLPDGGWLEVDGACESPPVLVEAWAHQGPPKSAQKHKVLADAMKLLYADSLGSKRSRLILAFAGREAAEHFQGRSWMAQALKANRIEVHVVKLPKGLRAKIAKAQTRQYR